MQEDDVLLWGREVGEVVEHGIHGLAAVYLRMCVFVFCLFVCVCVRACMSAPHCHAPLTLIMITHSSLITHHSSLITHHSLHV